MKDLITEARELCERAEILVNELHTERIDYNTEYLPLIDAIQTIPELCDALEKATAKNDELIRELSQLARESVERDMALARLEAEVMAACNSVRWVPVAERLPTERGYYLAVIKRIAPDELGGNLTNVKIMRWLGEDWRYPRHIPEWINETITETVTHWMPLPAAPEEGERAWRD